MASVPIENIRKYTKRPKTCVPLTLPFLMVPFRTPSSCSVMVMQCQRLSKTCKQNGVFVRVPFLSIDKFSFLFSMVFPKGSYVQSKIFPRFLENEYLVRLHFFSSLQSDYFILNRQSSPWRGRIVLPEARCWSTAPASQRESAHPDRVELCGKTTPSYSSQTRLVKSNAVTTRKRLNGGLARSLAASWRLRNLEIHLRINLKIHLLWDSVETSYIWNVWHTAT